MILGNYKIVFVVLSDKRSLHSHSGDDRALAMRSFTDDLINVYYVHLVTETSSVPDQSAAAVNLGEQGPSSISEAVFHPDLTILQQQIVGDVVSSGRENGKKSRKPRISESIILNDGSCASITLLF